MSKERILQDLSDNREYASVFYKKYSKETLVKMLENPFRYEKDIRELSNFLYEVSNHYKRLVDYYSRLILYNYLVIPRSILDIDSIDKKEFALCYQSVINDCEKYNFKDKCPEAIKLAIKNGIYCGLYYEKEDSFDIISFDVNYTKISKLVDGCLKFAIDLSYFSRHKNISGLYGKAIENAYKKYKTGNGGRVDYSKRWYEPRNGICIKVDPSDYLHSLPLFTGLLTSIFDIEDYKMLQKAMAENNNYKAVSFEIETDENGIPKMDEDMFTKWFGQASDNIKEDVGLVFTPFKTNVMTFQDNKTSDKSAAMEAQEDFYFSAGTSSLIFGSPKASSSSSLELSVKPDEQISYGLLRQLQSFFNTKIKLKRYQYKFKVEFLNQSEFNESKIADIVQKAATYGVSGAKLKYAAAIGLSPSDVIGMAYLEDQILEVGTNLFARPLISSNTLSNGETGRPTNKQLNEPITEAGEDSIERK